MAAGGECQLADGRAVVLRLAGPAHVPAITRLYRDLSPESFARRFHGGRIAPSALARLASLDGGTVCLVVAPPGDPGWLAAEARYVPMGSGTAELALAVSDSYQGAGMGHLLLEALVRRAREDGLDRLRAAVLLDNTAMLRLLQRYGWVLAAATEEFSVACLEISVTGGMPSWPAGSVGRRVLWNGAAGSTTSRSRRCVPPETTSASAPGRRVRSGPARWPAPGSAGSPSRQT